MITSPISICVTRKGPKIPPVTALAADPEPQINKETLRMWHSRHGYLGYQNLKKLAKIYIGIDLTIPSLNDTYELYSIANIKVKLY